MINVNNFTDQSMGRSKNSSALSALNPYLTLLHQIIKFSYGDLWDMYKDFYATYIVTEDELSTFIFRLLMGCRH